MQEIIWLKKADENVVPCVNNFLFNFNRNLCGDSILWKCHKKDCNVYLTTQFENFIKLSSEHSHSDDLNAIIKMQLKDFILQDLKNNPFLTSKTVFDNGISRLSLLYRYQQEIIGRFPSFSACKTIIYRYKHMFIPTVASLNFSSLNFDLFNMQNGGNLLIYSNENPFKIVIIGNPEYILKFTCRQEFKVYMDGTFNSAPYPFDQLYILHSEINGQSFPLLYCFIQGKTQEVYTELFIKIKSCLRIYNVSFEPNIVQIDFEYAAYNAVCSVFTGAEIKGCFFHFGQALFRKLVSLGLKSRYNNDVNFRHCFECISSLALIPLHDIMNAWIYIQSLLLNPSVETILLFEYVENNWLSNDRPLFSRDVWSQNGVLRGRTNNALEGLHSKLNRQINKVNPNFFVGVIKLIGVEWEFDVELARILNGGIPKPRKRVYVLQDDKIRRLLNFYQEGTIDLYALVRELKNAIKMEI